MEIINRTTVSFAAGPLVRSECGPTTADILAMIHDGRLAINSETSGGKKIYDIDRVRLGIVAPRAPVFTSVAITTPLTPVLEVDEQVQKVIKKKPTALEKTLKGLTSKTKKFARST